MDFERVAVDDRRLTDDRFCECNREMSVTRAKINTSSNKRKARHHAF
jgi:hypothetical protein